MKQLLVIFAVLALVGAAFAEGLPSSKATAAINTLVKCTMSAVTIRDGAGEALIPEDCTDLYSGADVATANQWIPIMSKKMKLSNSQSVFVSPSLVSGLYTRTRTVTKTGETSTASAMGAVYMRAVLEDESGNLVQVAAPIAQCAPTDLDPTPAFGCVNLQSGKWGVTLDSRVQTLTQALSACVIDVTSLAPENDGSCSFTSTIDLLLETASANTFNVIFPNVGQGTYVIKIYAAVGSSASLAITGSNSGGTAIGAAVFGLGSMLAESVRLVHDFEF